MSEPNNTNFEITLSGIIKTIAFAAVGLLVMDMRSTVKEIGKNINDIRVEFSVMKANNAHQEQDIVKIDKRVETVESLMFRGEARK